MRELRPVIDVYRATGSIESAAALFGWTLEHTRRFLRATGQLPWTLCVRCGIDNGGARVCPECRYCRPCGR